MVSSSTSQAENLRKQRPYIDGPLVKLVAALPTVISLSFPLAKSIERQNFEACPAYTQISASYIGFDSQDLGAQLEICDYLSKPRVYLSKCVERVGAIDFNVTQDL